MGHTIVPCRAKGPYIGNTMEVPPTPEGREGGGGGGGEGRKKGDGGPRWPSFFPCPPRPIRAEKAQSKTGTFNFSHNANCDCLCRVDRWKRSLKLGKTKCSSKKSKTPCSKLL